MTNEEQLKTLEALAHRAAEVLAHAGTTATDYMDWIKRAVNVQQEIIDYFQTKQHSPATPAQISDDGKDSK